jgi:hypothetical protein
MASLSRASCLATRIEIRELAQVAKFPSGSPYCKCGVLRCAVRCEHCQELQPHHECTENVHGASEKSHLAQSLLPVRYSPSFWNLLFVQLEHLGWANVPRRHDSLHSSLFFLAIASSSAQMRLARPRSEPHFRGHEHICHATDQLLPSNQKVNLPHGRVHDWHGGWHRDYLTGMGKWNPQ